MTTALITGGLGFIGSALARMLTENDTHVIILDSMTYAADKRRIEGIPEDRITLIIGDVANPESYVSLPKLDAVFHLAAETHVDRSIKEPGIFVHSNVLGTQTLLDAFKEKNTRIVVISTDEVYGSAAPNAWFKETDILHPSSPYSASKASSDMIAMAYHTTYGMDVMITRCTNNYGPWQSSEKLIPFSLSNILNGTPCLIYGNGLQERDWIHVDDHCRALIQVFYNGKSGEIYNIGTGFESTNMQVMEVLHNALGADVNSVLHIKDRPGHDVRYAVNNEKIRALGWFPVYDFKTGVEETAKWYKDHQNWLTDNKAGMSDWFKNQYK